MAFDRGRGSSGKDDDRKWLEEANLAVSDGVAGWRKEGCGESPVLSRERLSCAGNAMVPPGLSSLVLWAAVCLTVRDSFIIRSLFAF